MEVSFEILPIFVSGKSTPCMHEKLAELHSLFKDATQNGQILLTLATNQRISGLVNEILNTFQLLNGYEDILLEFCRYESLTDELIDKTLIKLADESVYYLTLNRLT